MEIYHTSSRIRALAAFGLMLLAFVVRLWHLNSTDIAGDEAFSVLVAQQDIGNIVRFLNTGNNPPLFELLLHVWMRVVGHTDFALRLLPAILSGLTVIPVFLIGVRISGTRTGIMAASLMTLSWQHVRFSHEVRAYALLVLLTATALLLLLQCMQRPLLWRNWLFLCVCNLALLYTHYLAVFAVGAQALTALVLMDKEGRARLLVMLLAVGILFAPGLYVLMTRSLQVTGQGTWVPSTDVRQLYGAINLMLNSKVTTLLLIMTVAIGSGLSLGKWSLKEWHTEVSANPAGKLVLMWWALTYGGLFVVSVAVLPLFIDRYLLFTSVGLYVAMAWAVDMAWKRTSFSWAGATLVAGAALLTTDTAPSNHRNVASAVNAVRLRHTESSSVVVAPTSESMAFSFHYDRELFGKVRGHDPVAALCEALVLRDIYVVDAADKLPHLMSRQVIFYDADVAFINLDNGIEAKLTSQYKKTETLQFESIFRVYVYE